MGFGAKQGFAPPSRPADYIIQLEQAFPNPAVAIKVGGGGVSTTLTVPNPTVVVALT